MPYPNVVEPSLRSCDPGPVERTETPASGMEEDCQSALSRSNYIYRRKAGQAAAMYGKPCSRRPWPGLVRAQRVPCHFSTNLPWKLEKRVDIGPATGWIRTGIVHVSAEKGFDLELADQIPQHPRRIDPSWAISRAAGYDSVFQKNPVKRCNPLLGIRLQDMGQPGLVPPVLIRITPHMMGCEHKPPRDMGSSALIPRYGLERLSSTNKRR